MREIVTLQVGSFANFVGSHFWNFQDELLGLAVDPQSDAVFKNQCLNMDVLYRSGETQQGILTYTPRLVSVDLQGSLGSVSSRGTLYNNAVSGSTEVVTWTGNVSTQASEPRKKNLFLQSLDEEEHEDLTLMNRVKNGEANQRRDIQDKDIVEGLENDVQTWTDFSKVHYHPQSLYQLSGLWMEPREFDNYGIGKESFSWSLQGDDISERLRFFVEECDHMQGFQFIVDDSGGFSAIAADFLENIADEYSNTPLLLYTVRSHDSLFKPGLQRQKVSRNLHDAVSFSKLSAFCNLVVPIGLPFLSRSKASSFLRIDDEKPYHSSAVYASALHSIGLPFRMEPLGPTTDSYYVSGAVAINGVVQMLAGRARQNIVAILDIAMPEPSLAGKQAQESLLRNLHPLTPDIAEDTKDFQSLEMMTVNGMRGSGDSWASVSEIKAEIHAAYEHATTRPMFCHLSATQCPLPIPLPFPSIFGNLIGQKGEVSSNPIPGSLSRGSLDVHSIPMAARLRSSNAILPFLENRLGNLRRLGIQQGAPAAQLLRSWGFGKEELEDMAENLSKMVMTLDPHSQVSSDSD